MTTRLNSHVIGGAAVCLFACASTTPKADSPAQSAAAAQTATAATAASTPQAAVPGFAGAWPKR
jgi:uncharacterized lipoprotein YbaY